MMLSILKPFSFKRRYIAFRSSRLSIIHAKWFSSTCPFCCGGASSPTRNDQVESARTSPDRPGDMDHQPAVGSREMRPETIRTIVDLRNCLVGILDELRAQRRLLEALPLAIRKSVWSRLE